MKIIKDNEELKSYIVNGSIVFNESIQCNFDIHVNANIDAYNIKAYNIKAYSIEAYNIEAYNIKAHNIEAANIDAHDIKAYNIKAYNIDAYNIDAANISYYAFCVSYGGIICTSIKGRRNNSFHNCLDGMLTIKEQTKKIIIDGKEIELSNESFEALKKSLL